MGTAAVRTEVNNNKYYKKFGNFPLKAKRIRQTSMGKIRRSYMGEIGGVMIPRSELHK